MIGMPEEEKKEQEIGNLFEKIMKENFPSLVKEIDMQIQHRESQTRWIQRSPRHFVIKMPKVKDKETILKAARENKLVTRWLPD